MTPLRTIICGAKGRMGQTLVACAKGDPALQLAGEVDVGDDLERVMNKCDVIVDFSVREATAGIARLASRHGKALVIGTTGHSPAEKQAVCDAIRPIACVWASNFSIGVNALFWIADKVAATVGKEWEVEIVETHHTAKKDAPSGTAKTLQEVIQRATGKDVPAHSLRLGDVVGDHTVVLGTDGERIELTHRASSRAAFARGALRAAKWAVRQKPGLYDMLDVLGLRS